MPTYIDVIMMVMMYPPDTCVLFPVASYSYFVESVSRRSNCLSALDPNIVVLPSNRKENCIDTEEAAIIVKMKALAGLALLASAAQAAPHCTYNDDVLAVGYPLLFSPTSKAHIVSTKKKHLPLWRRRSMFVAMKAGTQTR